MAKVESIEAGKYNNLLAEALMKEESYEAPEWIHIVKTSTHKERPTDEENFWHKRAASILRQIYIKGIVGVGRLRTRYGGKKARGKRPAEFRKSGGKIIRTILQQSEKAGFLEKSEENKKGRKLTEKGRAFLESIASKGAK
jgi:small subunit ribosomal protein S19e